jgi:transcriptional repressor CTCF
VRHVRYRHTHEKPHKCPECDYASVELSKLKRHIRCHTGERPYQCPHCTYASPDTFKLKRHLRIHTGEKPYQCDICNARFTQSNSLKAHKLIHSVGEKPVFQCELCPTTCGRKTDLRIHIQKLHTSDVPIKCKRCPEEFPDRYSYKIHAKTHEGEKCYKCEICPYASISARHLDSHMLVHTDQKPFQCSFCEQTFRQKQLLKRHENIYHNPNYVATQPKEKTHFCPTCTKGFRHKGNLMRHMTTHDMKKKVYMKEEGNNEEGDYVVFEVIQDGQDEEIYEGEESEGEVQQDGAEDGNYILAESKFLTLLVLGKSFKSLIHIFIYKTDIDADDIIIKASPKGAGTSSITFGFSDDEEDEGIKN